MSRRRHEPTTETRAKVQSLAAFGITKPKIARHIGIDEKTLRKYYREELDTAEVEANAAVAQSLFNKAIGGNVAAQIFWCKTRMGWKETSKLEVEDQTPHEPTDIKERLAAKLGIDLSKPLEPPAEPEPETPSEPEPERDTVH